MRRAGELVDLHNRTDRLLLGYLGLQSGRPVSRDKLCGLLWADRAEEQARGSLRQSLGIAIGLFGLISPRRSRALTQDWIRRLKVRAPGPSVTCRTLSGGNQQKVVFAKWLARGVNILVLDDPGRGLDVGAKEDIYSLMREVAGKGAAVLLVSDNLPELIGLSNRIMVLRNGMVSAMVEARKEAKPREVDIVSAML